MLTVEEDITYALLPCPACGAHAMDEDEPLHMVYDLARDIYYCRCDRCGKMSAPAYFREHALYAWQTERRDG